MQKIKRICPCKDMLYGKQQTIEYENEEEDTMEECNFEEQSAIECQVFGCGFTCDDMVDYERHYFTCHQFQCNHCKEVFANAHLMDLHITETHDPFFSILVTKRPPQYKCYLADCKVKCNTKEERRMHLIQYHSVCTATLTIGIC